MYRLLIAVTLLTCFSSYSSAEIVALGTLDGIESQVTEISADGSTVVGYSDSNNRAFRWTQGDGMIDLGTLPGGSKYEAYGVSADGIAIVGRSGLASGEAFYWTPADGMVGLGDLPGDPFWSGARGISWDGSVVVGSGHGNCGNEPERMAFRWTADEGMISLFSPDDECVSIAIAVSGDATTIVGSNGPDILDFQAFRWTQSTGPIGLGHLPGGDDKSAALAVSADGSVVVGYDTWGNWGSGEREAFRWTAAEGMVGLGFLPGGNKSQANGVSADGSVIVGTSTNADGDLVGFVWTTETGMRSLLEILMAQGDDLSYWTKLSPSGISADGTKIAGTGRRSSDNEREAFLAILEPSIVTPASFTVTRGEYVSGSISDLEASDNSDLTLRRRGSDIQSRTELEIEAFSPTETPSSLVVTLEGAVFARSTVNQTLELFDYAAAAWETVDTRAATRFTDSTVQITATGDLSRFVDAGTMSMKARVRYQSPVARQQFSSNTDQFIWTIGQ